MCKEIIKGKGKLVILERPRNPTTGNYKNKRRGPYILTSGVGVSIDETLWDDTRRIYVGTISNRGVVEVGVECPTREEGNSG